jgi:hypothetical protein
MDVLLSISLQVTPPPLPSLLFAAISDQHRSVDAGHYFIVQHLVSAGADVALTDSRGLTPAKSALAVSSSLTVPCPSSSPGRSTISAIILAPAVLRGLPLYFFPLQSTADQCLACWNKDRAADTLGALCLDLPQAI